MKKNEPDYQVLSDPQVSAALAEIVGRKRRTCKQCIAGLLVDGKDGIVVELDNGDILGLTEDDLQAFLALSVAAKIGPPGKRN